MLLLCSDGLTRMVTEPEIAGTLQAEPNPQRAAEKLIEHANESGGVDNVSVIVVSIKARTQGLVLLAAPRGAQICRRKWFRRRSLKWPSCR